MKIDIKEPFQSFLLDFNFFVDLCLRVHFRVNSRYYITSKEWWSDKNFSFDCYYSTKDGGEFSITIADSLQGPGMRFPLNEALEKELKELCEKGICREIWDNSFAFNQRDVFFSYIKELASRNPQYDFDISFVVEDKNRKEFFSRMDKSEVVPDSLKEFFRKGYFDGHDVDCGDGKELTASVSPRGDLHMTLVSNHRCYGPM